MQQQNVQRKQKVQRKQQSASQPKNNQQQQRKVQREKPQQEEEKKYWHCIELKRAGSDMTRFGADLMHVSRHKCSLSSLYLCSGPDCKDCPVKGKFSHFNNVATILTMSPLF